MRCSVFASGCSVTSYVCLNAPGAVTLARKSPALKPSGATRSTYASALLPTVSVAPAGSQGSVAALGLVVEKAF